jgi:hypothetical protein
MEVGSGKLSSSRTNPIPDLRVYQSGPRLLVLVITIIFLDEEPHTQILLRSVQTGRNRRPAAVDEDF